MVEPACGAALAAVYCDVIKSLQQSGELRSDLQNIVVIVCGGFCVNSQALKDWRVQVGLDWTGLEFTHMLQSAYLRISGL